MCRPSFGEEECEAVRDCLMSGWVSTGPRVQAFGEALQDYFGGRHVLPVGSNTAGMYVALKALGVGPGDEVITTPLTFTATANVIEVVGANPVLCDVDPHTRNIDLQDVASKITPRTRVILPVHFAGLPVSLKGLEALGKEHHVRIIEDAAHALGTSDQGQLVGSTGDIQVFSFHANKNLATGEGGCIVTGDDALFEQLKPLHFHGLDRLAWDRFQKKGKSTYDVVVAALKFNMTDMQGALGLCQIKKFPALQEKRRRLAQRYLEALADVDGLILPEDHKGHAWHLFSPLLCLETLRVDREAFVEALKQHNVGASVHYQALHLFSYYRQKYHYKEGDFPHAEAIAASTVSLPLFPDLTFEDQDRVVEVVKKLVKELRR
ncbi:DegT/DnrJ/EryC1/StrS aminotransferase family protein [bacterium NHP-B]|nr:DegT/DnrJ/EryC1/StrS aminotransferase family protein [bacterium NHP-B]